MSGKHLYNFDTNTEMEVHSCPSCGMPYAAPVNFFRRINNGQDENSWYCPRGHAIRFTETDACRLKNELSSEARRRELAEARAETAERRRRAQKAVTTRLKNRVGQGVCPCCNRYFKDLHSHMKTKHQDYINSSAGLKTLRQKMGLSQTAIAEMIGVSCAYISLYENNKPLPVEAKEKIAQWIEDN